MILFLGGLVTGALLTLGAILLLAAGLAESDPTGHSD